MSIQRLIHFLNDSPTAWHAVDYTAKTLEKNGFVGIRESEDWSKLKCGGKYFTLRNGSSLVAFILPKKPIKRTLLLGSHTDSPSLKLKPKPLFSKDNLVMLGLEIYGGPLLTSWFNRDLGIAGRVVVEGSKGKLETHLVNVREHPVVIPQLAIHLDREVNEKGFAVNKQEGLNALVGILDTPITLERLLNVKGTIISHDLFLYPLEEARLTGINKEFLTSYRIDNLTSVWASVEALLKGSPQEDTLQMIALWDHEEIGSQSHYGAGAPFVKSILERLTKDSESYHQMIARSTTISIDLAHATHPNYSDKHEPRHPIRLGGGVVLKYSSGYRYATDAETAAPLIQAAKKGSVSLQEFVTHGNIPAGSTIGPIHAGVTGMPTLDIGIPQLSMHSIRELIAIKDYQQLVTLLTKIIPSL